MLRSAGVVMWSLDGAAREGSGSQDGGGTGGGTGGREKTAPCMIYWSGITELFPTERRGRWRDKLSRDSILRGKGRKRNWVNCTFPFGKGCNK